jgi:RNA-splicing ligase RtcB
MARRITERQRLAFKLEHLSDTEVHEVLDYISIMESMRRAASRTSNWDDELVSLLAGSEENERARQAFEWESVRRRAERKAALTLSARA